MAAGSCWKNSPVGANGTCCSKILLSYLSCVWSQAMWKHSVYFSTYALPLASPDYIIQSKQGREPKGNGNFCCCSLSLDGCVSETQKTFTKWILVYTMAEEVSPPFSRWWNRGLYLFGCKRNGKLRTSLKTLSHISFSLGEKRCWNLDQNVNCSFIISKRAKSSFYCMTGATKQL